MVVSRVLPTLIRFNHMINPIIKVESFGWSGVLVKSFHIAKFAISSARLMSIEVDKTILNDPKRHLDYETFMERRKSGKAYVIDVRQPAELTENGKIPNSINIPLPEVDKALGEMSSEEFKKTYGAEKPKKNDELIFTCNSGKRSVKALKISIEHGYVNSANYTGGWQEWSQKNKE